MAVDQRPGEGDLEPALEALVCGASDQNHVRPLEVEGQTLGTRSGGGPRVAARERFEEVTDQVLLE